MNSATLMYVTTINKERHYEFEREKGRRSILERLKGERRKDSGK